MEGTDSGMFQNVPRLGQIWYTVLYTVEQKKNEALDYNL